MPHEPTSELNEYRLTTKQHFHMASILRRFSSHLGIRVVFKDDGREEFVEEDSPLFMARRAWSQEFEGPICSAIEDKFIREVQRVERGEDVVNHDAISRYHLLWVLRHHYALNPLEETAIFPDLGGTLPQDLEEWLEARKKVPVREGGKIAGRFITTQSLKADLAFPKNTEAYIGIFWNVLHSSDEPFISPDCPDGNLFIAASPQLAFKGGYSKLAPRYLTATQAAKLNLMSAKSAVQFVFG